MDEGARQREQNQQVLIRLFAHLNAREYEAALELFADDLLWEMPFAPPALHAPFNRARFGKLLRSFPLVFSRGLTFDDLKFTPMFDPDQFLLDYRGEAVMAATGQPYRNTYVGIFELSGGRIIHTPRVLRFGGCNPRLWMAAGMTEHDPARLGEGRAFEQG